MHFRGQNIGHINGRLGQHRAIIDDPRGMDHTCDFPKPGCHLAHRALHVVQIADIRRHQQKLARKAFKLFDQSNAPRQIVIRSTEGFGLVPGVARRQRAAALQDHIGPGRKHFARNRRADATQTAGDQIGRVFFPFKF